MAKHRKKPVESKKYPKLPNVQPKVGLVQLACCDCGLVHTMGFTSDKQGLRLEFVRDNRATGQMRRGSFAYLKNPKKGDKWKMVEL